MKTILFMIVLVILLVSIGVYFISKSEKSKEEEENNLESQSPESLWYYGNEAPFVIWDYSSGKEEISDNLNEKSKDN